MAGISITHWNASICSAVNTHTHTSGSAWLRDIGLVEPVFLSPSWHPLRHLCKTEWQSLFLPASTHTYTRCSLRWAEQHSETVGISAIAFEKIKECNLGLLFSWIKEKMMPVPQLTPRPLWWLIMSACLLALPVCLSNGLTAYYSYSINRQSQLSPTLL